MKRRFTCGLMAVMLAATCAAQIRGVPAGVQSGASGFSDARGIPASVSSLGPRGYGSQVVIRDPNSDFVPLTPPRRDRLGRVALTAPIPLFYYGDIYPIIYLPREAARDLERSARRAPEPEPQKIIVEIRDTRPVAAAEVSREVAKEIERKPAPRPEVEQPRAPTVFIFQDGSRKELKDFAITQTELIDLSDGLIRRSPLAALDRAATLKINAEHGVEVRFPTSSSD